MSYFAGRDREYLPFQCLTNFTPNSSMVTPHRYFALHKPRNMVSQFVSSHEVGLLGQLGFDFPEGTHAIGRLDSHSEGLLLLTTNKRVTKLLFQGEVTHNRTYLVQVKYAITPQKLQQLQQGVSIRVRGGGYYTAKPCDVSIVTNPEKYVSDPELVKLYHAGTWLLMTLTEGKFHQVRKMVFALGHTCVRLIRISIENLKLADLEAGAVKEYEEETFFSQLGINNWQGLPMKQP